jgi:hypothetical protein
VAFHINQQVLRLQVPIHDVLPTCETRQKQRWNLLVQVSKREDDFSRVETPGVVREATDPPQLGKQLSANDVLTEQDEERVRGSASTSISM